MSKSNENKSNDNYKNWTFVRGLVNEAVAKRDTDDIEKYPDWAKDYHSVYDPTSGKFAMNPDIVDSLNDKLWSEGGAWDTLQSLADEAPSGQEILEAGIDIIKMLLEKNIAYSNSAMDPLNILSTATPEEQIKMHIDNKLTRLKYQKEFQNEDSLKDLAGYVILLMVLKSNKEMMD